MTQGTWNIDYGPLRGFYRDPENGWIFGVCAGLADRFNLNLPMVRILAGISLLVFSWLTIMLYIGATLLIRQKPLIYSGTDDEQEFWRRRREDYWRNT